MLLFSCMVLSASLTQPAQSPTDARQDIVLISDHPAVFNIFAQKDATTERAAPLRALGRGRSRKWQ